MSKEQFYRTELLLGSQAMHKLHTGQVTIIGLGAVGSYATEALARAGVGNLTLIDFDVVSETNINRQLFALHSTIGQKKADLACQRVKDINPDCNVTPMHLFVHADTAEQFLNPKPQLIIDCIDSLNPKLALLELATEAGIPIISSMGAALRNDPTKIKFGPLKQTNSCPLARLVRKKLRKIKASIEFDCVYSTEEVWHKNNHAIVDGNLTDHMDKRRGRVRRSMGSLPTITGIFGLTLANEAIKIITK
ncbi:MAG: tRNA threonylcarbamoyladenosine dehydratase [Phycisphaerae bacterium]|nr:tRNA threonylcarbamoyladenosine dehydratase [Phycisphaerae bacterium]